jgi:hypothetical protein
MALTPDEHQELRRIHVLAQFGDLPEIMRARYQELRDRDEHLEIPEPTLDVEWMPVQPTRDEALDNFIANLDADDEADDDAELEDMSAFETSLRQDTPYVVGPPVGGFVPSQYFGSR